MPSRNGSRPAARRALATLTVPQELLNAAAERGIGTGFDGPSLRHMFNLPMLGEIELSVDLRVLHVSFEVDPQHGDRLLATITGAATVEFAGDLPSPEEPIGVVGRILVRPVIEQRPDGGIHGGLLLASAELVDMRTAEHDLDPADAMAVARAQMNDMILDAIGAELFEMVLAKVDDVTVDIPPDITELASRLGFAGGGVEIEVHEGELLVVVPVAQELDDKVRPIPADGRRLGVGVASGVLARLVAELGTRVLGGVPLPFDIEVDADDDLVAGQLRNARVFRTLPDLRPGLRYTVRPGIEGDRLVLRLEEAWLELAFVPGVVNRLNRAVGGVVARSLPAAIRLPMRWDVPLQPGKPDTVGLTVDEVVADDHTVGIVIAAQL